MSAEFHNSKQRDELDGPGGLDGADGFDTLRALARLPAPEHLPGRVHARLRQHAMAEYTEVRRGFWAGAWRLWRPAQRLQFAGAAALALAVAGSTWSVYHARLGQGSAGGAPAQTPALAPANGFGGAKAERVPPTLKPILVPPVAHKKPGAGKSAIKATPKALAMPAASPDSDSKPINQ